MTATPRPWHYIKSSVSIFSNETDDVERIKICDTSTHSKSVQEAQANAALIVKACNAHDKLVDALKGCLQALRHAPIEGAFGKDARYKAEQVLREVGNDAL